MALDTKKHLRAIVRRVHPDLFTAHPREQACNSDSLKLLNNYMDAISRGASPERVSLEFWVKGSGEEGTDLSPVRASLSSAAASLAPLFHAFGLISGEEMAASVGQGTPDSDEDLLEWLRDTVQEAVAAADQHSLLKQRINDLRAAVEERYNLGSILLGNEYGASQEEQQQQLESLRTLNQGLEEVCANGHSFEGLSLCVHHPRAYPLDPLRYAGFDAGLRCVPRTSRIADDGRIHVVADAETIVGALSTVDIDWAQLLSRLSGFWVRRARDMATSLKEVLRVEDVLCDTTVADNAQKFVLWSGCIMEHRDEISSLVSKREHSFSVLLHSDTAAPMIDYLDSTSILQVRSDCPPGTMVDFLASDTCLRASRVARHVLSSDDEEERVLEAARAALGAKHVIRVCSINEREAVIAAARRLIDDAPAIRERVDLSGASIAIDNCYQMWEAGFLSIPHDFQLQELQPRLKKMLGAGEPRAPGPGGAGGQGALDTEARAAGSGGSDPRAPGTDATDPGSVSGNGISAPASEGGKMAGGQGGAVSGSGVEDGKKGGKAKAGRPRQQGFKFPWASAAAGARGPAPGPRGPRVAAPRTAFRMPAC